MCVDVRRRAEITVAQPFLNLFERDVMCQQERGAAVTQIVEANMPKPVLRQRAPEVGGKVGGQRAPECQICPESLSNFRRRPNVHPAR